MSNVSSSDSDSFENLLTSIKKSIKSEKYRMSTGSLDDFLTDGSESEKSIDETSDLKKPSTIDKPKKVFKSNSSVHKKFAKFKSVVTPRRPVVFSSDSDDNVFLSAQANRNSHLLSLSCSSKRNQYLFTDSEKENDQKNDFIEPQKLTFSDDGEKISEKRNQVFEQSRKTTLFPSSYSCTKAVRKSVDSDSDAELVSLTDRLSHLSTTSKPNDCNLNKSTHSVEIMPLTPLNVSVKKRFHTEKVNRTVKKVCSIKGCFLSSLSFFTAQNSGTQFKKTKSDLTCRLFKFFNATIFDNLLPESMQIIWSNRLTKTAGFTKCRRLVKTYSDNSVDRITTCSYEAAISLSEKILDNSSRLRDTLIHELCHAAVWVLDNASESHGPIWRSWAAKARKIHPELPLIERCHNYDIDYKYKYQCNRYSGKVKVVKAVFGIGIY